VQNRKFKKEDVEKMLQLLETSAKALPNLRVFLVELKGDFVQSFKLNMSNPQLRRGIFAWLDATFKWLSKENEAKFQELKGVVQRSVRDLISISDGESVALLDAWFEESYQEQLILEELAVFPEIQFNYLKKFLAQNEARVKQTINEATYAPDKRAEAQRFVEYLVLHTRLLCRFARTEVHEFVRKDFYPIGECLQVCREAGADKAVAELLRRNGNFLESIQAYLALVARLPRQELLQELHNAAKQHHKNGMTWEFLGLQKLEHAHEFDLLLDKALKIADKQQAVVGEEGWFVILEFLAKFRAELQDRLFPATISGGATQLSAKDKAKLDCLKDFVTQRKNMVLKLVPASVSL